RTALRQATKRVAQAEYSRQDERFADKLAEAEQSTSGAFKLLRELEGRPPPKQHTGALRYAGGYAFKKLACVPAHFYGSNPALDPASEQGAWATYSSTLAAELAPGTAMRLDLDDVEFARRGQKPAGAAGPD
ncbi:unnamed protein product, partial [Amoebophrya sp. A120]